MEEYIRSLSIHIEISLIQYELEKVTNTAVKNNKIDCFKNDNNGILK